MIQSARLCLLPLFFLFSPAYALPTLHRRKGGRGGGGGGASYGGSASGSGSSMTTKQWIILVSVLGGIVGIFLVAYIWYKIHLHRKRKTGVVRNSHEWSATEKSVYAPSTYSYDEYRHILATSPNPDSTLNRPHRPYNIPAFPCRVVIKQLHT